VPLAGVEAAWKDAGAHGRRGKAEDGGEAAWEDAGSARPARGKAEAGGEQGAET
jgi:hypothetical protein